jgi:SAM-dependent methyltransferase
MTIEDRYTSFYARNIHRKVYPTEFVVRAFLSQYPGLTFTRPAAGARILDVACGDGRNSAFLSDLGYTVCGIEISQGIVDVTQARMEMMNSNVELRVGRNSSIPYDDSFFDCILACHCCYYCDEGETILDNMKEYSRVLNHGGWLICSIADERSYIFKDAVKNRDRTYTIVHDPYGNREGYRLQAFSTTTDIEAHLGGLFDSFSFGHASNDYFGIHEQVFWVVARKKLGVTT